MGDAGTMSVAAADYLSSAGVQTVTGAKTFNDQKLKLRNPADTFTGTVLNPVLTADKNIQYGFPVMGNYIAYRSPTGAYVAKNLSTNAIDYSSAAAGSVETAIQTAITNAGQYGTVYIHGTSTFPVSAAFTGFNLLYHQQIIMGHGTRISLPTGYSGSVFKIIQANGSGHVYIYGGMIQELTTPSRLWTGIEIQSDTATGVWGIRVRDMRMYAFGKGIAIKTDGTGWSNASTFDGLFLDSGNIGVSFEHTGTFTPFASGANNNMFSNITHQAVASTTHGFKDVNGRRNTFMNDYIADFTGAQVTCNITANAADTLIMGGSTTALNFTDLSPSTTPTVIQDAFQNSVAYKRKTMSYEDNTTISAPANPATGFTRRYAKVVDANNDGLFVKRKINGAIVEVQL
jgi:hypothetical protein